MSKNLFLSLLPLLALAMTGCSRGNGGTSTSGSGSSSQAADSSEAASSEEASSEEESSEETSYVASQHTYQLGTGEAVALYVDPNYDSESDIWGGVAKYTSGPISVTAGDAIVVTAVNEDESTTNVYKNGSNARNNVAGDAPGSYTVKATAEDAVLELYQYADGWAFNLSGLSSEGVPTEGFAIVVTTGGAKSYTPATPNGKAYVEGKTKDEYYAAKVTVADGSVVTCYDAENEVEWAIQGLNPHSVAGTYTAEGITFSAGGTYDMYIQLLMGDDTIYIGEAAA